MVPYLFETKQSENESIGGLRDTSLVLGYLKAQGNLLGGS